MAMNRNKKIVYIALLIAQGVVLGLIENSIPSPFPFAPGAKLGLANLITLIAIFTMKKRESLFLVLGRLLLTTLLGGTVSMLLYSFAGSMLSYFGMLLVKALGPKRVSIVGISATGGFMHNVGQLIVASWMAQSWTVMLYLPILSFMGIIAGAAIGLAGNYLFAHIKTLQEFRFEYENPQNKKGAQ